MAKKYLKNNQGIVRAITTDTLQLEKPLGNENYDIEVHNRNMDKLDSTIQELKGKVDGLELKAEKVSIEDNKDLYSSENVEDALSESMLIVLGLQSAQNKLNTKVDDTVASIGNKIHSIVSDINKLNFELRINNYITSENMKHVFVDTINSSSDIVLTHGMFSSGKVYI